MERGRGDERPALQDADEPRRGAGAAHRPADPAASPARTAPATRTPMTATGTASSTLRDYACDSRVNLTDPRRVGPAGTADPPGPAARPSPTARDGDDGNGYVDDIVGWDFLDNDNDPFDDVLLRARHRRGRGLDGRGRQRLTRSAPARTACRSRCGSATASSPTSTASPQAVLYAVDNGVQVVQSALGTLNNSSLARDAVEYAYDHGVDVVVSAADEAAQHNNQPYLPKTILVNSVTRSADDGAAARPVLPRVQRLHQLQRQDHAGDPLDELLLGRGRRRLGLRRRSDQRRAQRPRGGGA